jgi:putative glycosyltransferase (TIGR04372 family)
MKRFSWLFQGNQEQLSFPKYLFNAILLLCSILFGFFVVVLQRILSSFIIIRIAKLNSQRIGHFILEVDWYLVSQNLPKVTVAQRHFKSLDLFFLSGQISNEYFSSRVRSTLNVLPKLILIGAYMMNRFLPDGDRYIVPLPDRPTDLSIFDNKESFAIFSEEEKVRGELILSQMGVRRNDKIVCFYIRDEAYGKKYFASVDQSYSDYRNSSLINYIEAMNYLVENGFTVFRMGKTVNVGLDCSNPKIIDYPNSPIQSDFMDFYIASRMEMAISTDSGMMQFPIWARKPFGLVNVPANHGMVESQYLLLFQFKTFFSSKFNRALSLNEMINTSLLDSDSSLEFQRKGLIHIENSKTEIYGFVQEFLNIFEDENTYRELSSQRISRLASSNSRNSTSWIPKKISSNWLYENKEKLF